jgi:hypothetical protein
MQNFKFLGCLKVCLVVIKAMSNKIANKILHFLVPFSRFSRPKKIKQMFKCHFCHFGSFIALMRIQIQHRYGKIR